jgi:branched-chain amino acid transport system permease protein
MRSDGLSAPFGPPARHGGLRGFLGVHPALTLGLGAVLLVPALTSGYWTFNVMAGLVLAISCLGLLVLVGWAREISLMQAALTGSALYACRHAYGGPDYGSGLGWPFPVAVAWAIGFVVAVSFVTALVSMRLAGPYVIVLTLSVQFWLENSVMYWTRFIGAISLPPTPRPDFFTLNLRSDHRFYYVILACLLVVMVFLHRARHSRFGRSMILAGSDPAAAACAGVSPWRYRVWAFVVAGACAGLAGALSAPLYFTPPGTLQYISFNSIFYLAVPVLAGFDSIAGTVAVAVVFTLLPQVLLEWRLNVYLVGGLGMLVGCLLGPRGLGALVSWRPAVPACSGGTA